MGSISVLFLLSMFLLAVDVKAQLNHSKIPLGSWLSPTANRISWVSPSGLFAFGFYPQDEGFAIGIWLRNQPNNTLVWTAATDNQPVSSKATLNLTSDGIKLLLRTEHGEETSIAGFPGYYSTSADSASMLDSSNFVLYNNSSKVIWESFDRPTDTILGGQNFSNYNADLVSRSDHSGRRYRLMIDSKGNLVSYPDNSTYGTETAYWSFDTFDGTSVILSLNQRGLLRLIYGGSSINISANNYYPLEKETTIIYRAMLDSDGIFKLYSHHFRGNSSNTSSKMYSEWSALRDQCEVKGFCGLNSYCIGTGSKADCHCYPGFLFINPKNKFLGCYNDFSEDGCSKGPTVPYNIIALPNISLGDFPYSVVRTKQENCNTSCLGDCNCRAAFYINGTCKKYKLPLKYGRSQNLSVMIFLKVNRRNDVKFRPSPSESSNLDGWQKNLDFFPNFGFHCIDLFCNCNILFLHI